MNGLMHIGKRSFEIGAILFLLILSLAFMFDQPLLMAFPFVLVIGFFCIQDIRVPFYLLMASLPISFHYMDKLDFPDEPFMLLSTLLFVFFVMMRYREHDWRAWLRHPLLLIILASFFWTFLSVVFSEDPFFSGKFLLKKMWYLVPFLGLPLVLFRSEDVLIRSFQWLFAPLLLITVLILYRFSQVGFRFEDVHDPLQPFFINHVIYGSMISCMIPLTFAAIFLSKKWSFAWFFAILGLVIFLVATYFSYSRAAWMAVIFGCGVFVLVRLKVMHYAILLFYALVLAGILWMAHDNTYMRFKPKFEKTVMHESLEDHILATIQGTDISSAERYYRWIAAIRMSQDHPIFGVGPNNFYEHYKGYVVIAFRTWVSRNFERSTTHNYFLYMLVEQGYPATILYGVLIFAIFFYGQRLYARLVNRREKIIVMAVLCMIGAVFINNFFSELLEIDKIGSLFFMGIAVLVLIDVRTRQKMAKVYK